MTNRKPRVAYFSPLPPQRSGVADYSRELLPHLAQLADITLFAADASAVVSSGWWRQPVRAIVDFPRQRWQFDLALYHLGNNRLHTDLYRLYCRFPGLIVLHDAVLHHFLVDITAGAYDFPAYARQLGYELGQDGLALARAIQFGGQEHPLFEIPLNRQVLDLSLGVIVHSQYVARQISPYLSHPPHVISHPIDITPATIDVKLPAAASETSVLFGSFGQLTAAKQIGSALAAFKRLLAAGINAHYLMLGASHPELRLPQLVARLGLTDRVTILDYASDLERFKAYIQRVDVVINLRYPTVGETSGPALRALAAGKALIVYDLGWYAELPANVAVKVPPLQEPALFDAMHTLAADPQRRQSLGDAARSYALGHLQGSTAASAYVQAIRTTMERVDAS